MLLEVLATFSLIVSVFCDTSAPENKYVEYIQGDVNIIISTPHGGKIGFKNSDIPMRQPGCKDDAGKCQFGEKIKGKECTGKDVCSIRTGRDMYSSLIARSVYDKFVAMTGLKPSFVKSELHRRRLDPNREIEEAAQGNEVAIEAYNAFHGSIEHAIQNFDGKPGFLLDFHGYSDKKSQNSTLLGYLIRPQDLNAGTFSKEDTSVRALVERTYLPVEEIIFGEEFSFGSMFEDSGYKALPSPRQHSPDGDKYFNGGYITQTYGSREKGNVDAIQLEFQSWIRGYYASEDEQDKFCEELAKNIYKFYQLYYEPQYDIVDYGTINLP